ncbi:MAG: sulfotransferase domain-containing protein [Phycisphaeraceae bacterium]|nr:sulfotransferase domain-containing protein [Phycisphaeraceae bacterium]MBX3366554.1 sulfotransferase domain-containing protein [Phycisphaeraceae bacterium]
MSSPITWIASYPKSGNTWVRFLLHQYFFGQISTSADIDASIPDVHVRATTFEGERIGDMMLAKTHHRLTSTMPYRDRTVGAIYIVRHPCDVIWSALNYTRLISTSEVAERISPEGYMRNFIRLGGDPLYLQFGFGSLLEHAGSWCSHPTLRVHVVRYEDLRLDAGQELASMLEFLGHTPDPERVSAAVDASSFDRLRSLECQEKVSGVSSTVFAGGASSVRTGRLFMNAATLGRSLDEIAPGLDELAEERFSWLLNRFGYEPRADLRRQRSNAS